MHCTYIYMYIYQIDNDFLSDTETFGIERCHTRTQCQRQEKRIMVAQRDG